MKYTVQLTDLDIALIARSLIRGQMHFASHGWSTLSARAVELSSMFTALELSYARGYLAQQECLDSWEDAMSADDK